MVAGWEFLQSFEFDNVIGVGLILVAPALIGFFLALSTKSREADRVVGPWWVMLGIFIVVAASEFSALIYIDHVRSGLLRYESFLQNSVEATILFWIAYPALTFPFVVAGAWLGGLLARVDAPWLYGFIWPIVLPGLGLLWFIFGHSIVCGSGWGCL
jgi:hypothetical protein